MSRVIWQESSDPADIEVTGTSLLDLSHLKSLLCFAGNFFLVSKWYPLDHWLSRSALRFRWPPNPLISFWTSRSHWLDLLYLFFCRFQYAVKKSNRILWRCLATRRKERTMVRLGIQVSMQLVRYYNLRNISWQSFVSQRVHYENGRGRFFV